MIFFKCAKKNEHMNCALGQMKKWVEEWYGSDDNTATEYGLPEDRYEAAALSLLVLDNAASDEEWYGSDDNNTATEYGLPEDRYEAAALSLLVLDNAASDEEKFVSDFFW